jgi:hypothetical protein
MAFAVHSKDWAAETTHHENIVTEMALAHVVGDDVEAALGTPQELLHKVRTHATGRWR